MIDNIEYFSAKTYHETDVPNKPIQGTGTIISSQGRYYLVTALHCMRKVDDADHEIVSPDWKKVSATVYLQDSEVDLEIKGLIDVDVDQDWAILEIDKPNIDFHYYQRLCLTTSFKMDDEFAAYGYPNSFDDGIYLEFTPTNKRGNNWRLKDVTEGGGTKAITAEKGGSGMGLIYKEKDLYCCLGIINKSVPGGDFNAMKLISAKYFGKYFPDIYQPNQSVQSAPPTDEQLNEQINDDVQTIYHEASDMELSQQFQNYMKLAQYKDAHMVIKKLWERHPDDEWTTLYYIHTSALTGATDLDFLREVGLKFNYSTPQSVVFAARSFANYGYPQTAVDIWYNNALRFNDNELDTLFYIELLDSPMKAIVYKDYQVAEEGKCVLYDDGHEHRHCLMAGNHTQMAKAMIGRSKDDEFVLNIAGEERKVKIIAIHDKYYSIIHRGLTDMMEQGGNNLMRPVKIEAEMTPDEVMRTLLEAAGIDPSVNVDVKLQDDYNALPSLILNCRHDDLLWSYYRFLYSDFQLIPCPIAYKSDERFRYINEQSCFVLDLSSVITLFENTCRGVVLPKRKMMVSNFLYEYIKSYQHRSFFYSSYDTHKTQVAGRIFRFSENLEEDLRLRYATLVKWMDDYCVKASSQFLLNHSLAMQEQDDAGMMFNSTMTLLMDDPSRVLVTEDWYHCKLLQSLLLMIDSDEYCKM